MTAMRSGKGFRPGLCQSSDWSAAVRDFGNQKERDTARAFEPDLGLVAVSAASGSGYAADWPTGARNSGCACLLAAVEGDIRISIRELVTAGDGVDLAQIADGDHGVGTGSDENVGSAAKVVVVEEVEQADDDGAVQGYSVPGVAAGGPDGAVATGGAVAEGHGGRTVLAMAGDHGVDCIDAAAADAAAAAAALAAAMLAQVASGAALEWQAPSSSMNGCPCWAARSQLQTHKDGASV